MNIKNCQLSDIDEIFRLYKHASDFQRSKKIVTVWPTFERSMVETEINENRQWKIEVDRELACVWAIAFEDEHIWEEKNKDSAVYIHRIATNPEFRGNNYVAHIVAWAKEFAISSGKQYVRLDTTGNNVPLIEHYKKVGFEFLGFVDPKRRDALPEHYSEAPVCLFEIDLGQPSD